MITPPSADLEVPAGEPLAAEARATDDSDRRPIVRLDVRLDAVEPKPSEGEAQGGLEGLGHVAAPGEGLADLVAEVGAAEVSVGRSR